jgi:hypothetical protein
MIEEVGLTASDIVVIGTFVVIPALKLIYDKVFPDSAGRMARIEESVARIEESIDEIQAARMAGK